jgi:hypothetical protein
VSSFSAANAPWPRIARGWRPITSAGLLRRGTTPWSAVRGCRPGSASAPCTRCSSGRRHRGRASRSSPACRSPRRSRSTRSAITQYSATPTMTSTPAKRPSCSWVAYRNISGWMWRCDTPRSSDGNVLRTDVRAPRCRVSGAIRATTARATTVSTLQPLPSTTGADRANGGHPRRVCPGTGRHAIPVPVIIPGRATGAPTQGPLLQL